jgi:23S rRNA pseudouridine1911/1915/1917 synthase
VYAKNKQTAACFSQQIQDDRFEKEYIAAVNKIPSPETAELSNLLFHDKSKNKTYVVKKKRNGVKEARLKYTLVSHDEKTDFSTLRIKLYTGRTHQIRVQLAFMGHSILGDRKYGSEISVKPIRFHSFLLSFYDPATNKKEIFTSTPDWIDERSSSLLYSDTSC